MQRALLALACLVIPSRLFAFDPGDVLTLTPVTGGAPSTAVIMPSTGGVPLYQYTQSNGTSVIVSPYQAPTFIYPGSQGAPTVMVQPNGTVLYRYESRTK